MTIDLKVLADNRDALLLAETIGWLHDYRKCSEEHLQTQAPGSKTQALPRSELSNKQPNLQNISLALPTIQSSSRIITNLLDNKTWSQDTLGQLLSRCHNTAHFDKQEPEGGEQNYPGTQISSSFGFERSVGTNLTARLWGLPWSKLATVGSDRQKLREKISTLLAQTVADSRRPINEVDLWSWGLLVGALYKSALAGALLGYQPQANDLHWRLLGIRVNGLDYLAGAARIPDLLARQELLNDGLDRARDLLEVTYPLGSEVYRDENGSVFVVPNIANLLEITDEHGTSLRALILETFSKGTVKDQPALRVSGEILPQIELEQQPWWGQDPEWEAKTQRDEKTNSPKNPALYGQELKNEIPGIGAYLLQEIVSSSDSDWVKKFWGDNPSDICTVCGLRPKREERDVCATCEKRRKGRMQEWLSGLNNAAQPQPTIWTNEVADKNGRLALLVGKFDLENWLSGDLVQTMLVKAEQNNPGGCTPKNPSPARLRRVWETTQRFWEAILDKKDSQVNSLLPPAPPRLILSGKLQKEQGAPDPQEQPICELLAAGFKLSVVWHDGKFIVCDSPDYFQTTTGKALANVLQKGAQFPLFTSEGYKKKDQKIGKFTIEKVEQQTSSYLPFIPLLAEPQIFMALLPADRALPMMQAIHQKYEREMGKVQNRLPLHLGVVFASRRTPLPAILDAGRAMLLNIPSQAQTWKVESTQSDGQTLTLELEGNGKHIDWRVPLKMGDGATEDQWYPYVYLEANAEPSNHTRRFQSCNPWTKQNGWLVRADDLKEKDSIYFTPSTFDFEFLDTASRRFEVHYDKDGRRPRHTRPFYLQDVERLENLWKGHFCRLKRSQFSQMLQIIEAARERWFGRDEGQKSVTDATFCRFVKDTLANASWPKGHAWKDLSEDQKTQLTEAAARGELADWAEIHLEILKEKMEGEPS